LSLLWESNPSHQPRSIGNAFKLQLPDSIKIHPAFYPDKLRKASQKFSPKPGPPPVNITGDDEWEVQEIPASKGGKYLYYRVK
jgi:hypothetical protein